MKSTYAIAMLVLLLVGIGGSVLGYNTAVNKINAHEAHAEEAHAEDTHAGDATHGTDEHAEETVSAEETGAEPVSDEEAVPAEDDMAAGEGAEAGATAAAAGAGDVDNGKSLYTGQCAGCHGANAEGGLGPALNDAAAWSDSEFHSALRTGDSPAGKLEAPMPQFGEGQLSDSDITDIHTFLQTL